MAVAALTLSGCAVAMHRAPSCPAGQEQLRTAQLFLGRKAPGLAIKSADLQAFIDKEIGPRFPEGVTVLEGGSRWQGADNMLIRDAAKVVMIVLPARGDSGGRLHAVQTAYRARFSQDTMLVVTPPSCVAL